MAELLLTFSTISFAVAGIFFVLSIFFWILFRIPTVVGDLSGRTAKKSIAKMRTANEKSGSKSYKKSKVNVERGKLTDTMKHATKMPEAQSAKDKKPDTGLLNENRAEPSFTEATGLLIDQEATASLNNSKVNFPMKLDEEIKLKILEEVILVHTDEVI